MQLIDVVTLGFKAAALFNPALAPLAAAEGAIAAALETPEGQAVEARVLDLFKQHGVSPEEASAAVAEAKTNITDTDRFLVQRSEEQGTG